MISIFEWILYYDHITSTSLGHNNGVNHSIDLIREAYKMFQRFLPALLDSLFYETISKRKGIDLWPLSQDQYGLLDLRPHPYWQCPYFHDEVIFLHLGGVLTALCPFLFISSSCKTSTWHWLSFSTPPSKAGDIRGFITYSRSPTARLMIADRVNKALIPLLILPVSGGPP